MKHLIRINLLLALIWLLVAGTTAAVAQSPAVVTVEPAEAVLVAGETVTLTVQVMGAADLFGVELHLFYDPAVVQVVDGDASRAGVQLTPGGLLDSEAGFTVANNADNQIGELDYAMTLLAPAGAVSGDGVIVTFKVRALADGSSPLSLSAILASADGTAQPVTVESGQLTVGAGSGNVPSPPLATFTPAAGLTETAPGQQATAVEETTTTREAPQAGSPTGPTATGTVANVAPEAATTVEAGDTSMASSAGDTPAATAIAGNAPATLPAEPSSQPETGDTDGQSLGPGADPITSSESSTADESGSDGDESDTSVLAGGLVLVAFLLIALLIFFGRRLLSRNQ